MGSILLTVFLLTTMASHAMRAMGNTSMGSMTYITFGKYPSGAVQISVKGDELWLVDNMQSVFRWTGSQWEKIPGWITNIGASPDGWAWGIGAKRVAYRWNKDAKKWEQMNNALGLQVNAMSKDEAVLTGLESYPWLFKNGAWTGIGFCCVGWVSIGEKEEVWGINSDTNNAYHGLYRYDINLGTSPSSWSKKLTGEIVEVDVQSPTRIVYRNNANQAFVLNSDNNWQMISANASSVTIGRSNIFLIETKVHHLT